jgi:hypothetical protein
LHAKQPWSEAMYNAKPTKCVAEVWKLGQEDFELIAARMTGTVYSCLMLRDEKIAIRY